MKRLAVALSLVLLAGPLAVATQAQPAIIGWLAAEHTPALE